MGSEIPAEVPEEFAEAYRAAYEAALAEGATSHRATPPERPRPGSTPRESRPNVLRDRAPRHAPGYVPALVLIALVVVLLIGAYVLGRVFVGRVGG